MFFRTALVILLAMVQHIYKEHFELFCFGTYVLGVVIIEMDFGVCDIPDCMVYDGTKKVFRSTLL